MCLSDEGKRHIKKKVRKKLNNLSALF